MTTRRATPKRLPTTEAVSADEPVRTPASRGWLTPPEAHAELAAMFGAQHAPSPRTILTWMHAKDRPLEHVRLGPHRVLVHRNALLAYIRPRHGAAPMLQLFT